MDLFPTDVQWHNVVIPLLLAATLLLTWWNGRKASLLLAILNRWLRWITFSLAAAFLSFSAEWFAKPFWTLVLVFFLGWFLVETIYHWIAIKALSQSSVPLFPAFKVNPQGEEWPGQKRFFALRQWLKDHEFKSICSLKAALVSDVTLRMHVFQSLDDKHRIQILLIPQRNSAVNMCFTIVSQTVEKSRFVTDNMFLPFGGFYPENWYLQRKPLARNLMGLYRRHLRRLENTKEVFVTWEDDPLDDVNFQQKTLERVNTDLGFLFPIAQREEYGKITWEGRYRVWKEIWMLNYLGMSYSY